MSTLWVGERDREQAAIAALNEQVEDNIRLQAEIERLRSERLSVEMLAVENFIEANKRQCSNCDHELIDLTVLYANWRNLLSGA